MSGDEAAREGGAPWTRGEVAWPLALLAGFGGAWCGILLGAPGAPALLASALFAPLHVRHLRQGAAGRASVLALGWATGIAGALWGVALEGGGDAVSRAALLVAPLDLARARGPWVEAGAGATLFLATLAAARASRGWALLPVPAAWLAAAASRAGPEAFERVRAGVPAVEAVLRTAPPGLVVQVAGALVAASAVAASDDEPQGRRERWRLAAGGLALQVAGLALAALRP